MLGLLHHVFCPVFIRIVFYRSWYWNFYGKDYENYDKLVRDKIPQVLDAKGIKSVTSTVEGEEYFVRLVAKLKEEVEEFAENVNEDEIADIMEVLNAIILEKGFSTERIEEIRLKKLEECGGFGEKIILEQTEE